MSAKADAKHESKSDSKATAKSVVAPSKPTGPIKVVAAEEKHCTIFTANSHHIEELKADLVIYANFRTPHLKLYEHKKNPEVFALLGDWTTHHHEEEIHSPESRQKLIHEIGHFLTAKPDEHPLKDFKEADYKLISS